MNDQSSRSHCKITLRVQQTYKYKTKDGIETHVPIAHVNLVDLAGSERGRTRKTNSNPDTVECLESEAISINKSLLVLNQVLQNLSADKSFAPFRESKLTQLLQNSIRGNTFTVMIVNVSPSPKDYGETLNSLEYASTAKSIRNTIMKNAEESLIQDVAEGVFNLDGLKHNLVQDLQRRAPDIRELRVSNLGIDELEKCMHKILKLCQGNKLTQLMTISFEGCDGLKELPASIAQFSGLKTLNLSKCSLIKELPPWLEQMRGLRTLDLGFCTRLCTRLHKAQELACIRGNSDRL